MRSGSVQDWNSLHAYYLDTYGSVIRDMQYEVDRVLTSLACSEDDAVLQRLAPNKTLSVALAQKGLIPCFHPTYASPFFRRYFNLTYDPTQIMPNNVNTVINALASSNRGRWLLWERFNETWDNNPVPPG